MPESFWYVFQELVLGNHHKTSGYFALVQLEDEFIS